MKAGNEIRFSMSNAMQFNFNVVIITCLYGGPQGTCICDNIWPQADSFPHKKSRTFPKSRENNMASMNTFIGPDLPSHDACALYFYFIFAATSFYFQQHFIFAAAFIWTATFISAATLNFAAQAFCICYHMFFNLQNIKSNYSKYLYYAASFICLKKVFKIAALLNLQHVPCGPPMFENPVTSVTSVTSAKVKFIYLNDQSKALLVEF